MKMPLRLVLLFAAVISLGAAAPRGALEPVRFGIGQKNFLPGDEIVITEVLSPSPVWQPGDRVVVRGHYRLQSAATARLSVSLTQTTRRVSTRSVPSQSRVVDAGEGSFELVIEVIEPGHLHVSFGQHNSSSFGTVYFHPDDRC
jgi:hypothetical protein